MKISLSIIIVVLAPLMLYAQEVYMTFVMEGKAPVQIDGRLDDWDSLAINEGTVGNYIAWDNTTPPKNKLDLSAVFRSFADEDALYFAIRVKDDHLVFNEGDYVRRWNDDSVEIFFDGDRGDLNKQQPDANDGQIRITFEDGETVLEGVSGLTGSILHYTPPLMWEALGVSARLSTDLGGYIVEARIPSYLLDLESVSIGTEIGVNIRVMDDDDGGRMDRFIDWANDQDNLSAELKTGNFGMLKITERYPNTASNLPPEQVDDDLHSRLHQAMKEISEGQTAIDLSAFTPMQRKKKELLPLIAVIQRSQEQIEDAISNFTDLIAVASSNRVKNWAYDQIAGCYLDIGKYAEAENIYETRLSQSEDSWLLMGIGDIYANQSCHEKALEYYQKVLDRYPESEYIDKIYYSMAGQRRALGDYAGARSFYNKLLTDHPNSHWAIYAKRRLKTLPVNEGSWATVEEVDELIGQEKYREAAIIYKNLLNSTDENDKRTVRNLGRLFYRRSVFRDIIVHVVGRERLTTSELDTPRSVFQGPAQTRVVGRLRLTTSELEAWVFSEKDALIITHADWYSALRMASRVRGLLRVKGRDAVRDAVPALIYRYRQNRAIPPDQRTEGDGEGGLSLLGLLNRIGDIRSKDILLEGVKYSPNMWKGFLVIGHSIVPALVDSLSLSSDVSRRTGAMQNVRNMAEEAPDFFTQQELSLIRTRLTESLGDENGVVRGGALQALAVFGDESVMPLLETIAVQDEYRHPFNGTYQNRIAAQKTLEAIRARLQPEPDLDKTKDD